MKEWGKYFQRLNFKYHNGNKQLVTENGDLCYNINYPKAKKGTEAVVKPRKGPPTYGKFFHFLHISQKICLSMYMYMSRYNTLTLCPLHSLSSIRDVFMQTGNVCL
jgi:hypothetical protein